MSEKTKVGSAAETAAKHIEDLILEGSLRPGDPLISEREMAGQLEVSRPTLRQSLKLLENKGLILVTANGARSVAPLATSVTDPLIELIATRQDVVEDYLELRATLERKAASLAALRATEVDRASLRHCLERIQGAYTQADPMEEAEVDVDLHMAVYEASHNVVLLQIMRALAGMLRKGVFLNREKLYALPEIRTVLRDQHVSIVESILSRDPKAAGDAAEIHMIYTREALAEIAKAESRLEISLRRIDSGRIVGKRD